jgi:hypothetical protein
MCLRPSFELTFLILDRLADVSTAPILDGLQYIPLDAPVTVVSGDIAGSGDSSVPETYVLPTAELLPPSAQAATISIEEFGDPIGFIEARDCQNLLSEGLPQLTAGRAVLNVEVAAGNDICLDVYGDTRIRADLLGYRTQHASRLGRPTQ